MHIGLNASPIGRRSAKERGASDLFVLANKRRFALPRGVHTRSRRLANAHRQSERDPELPRSDWKMRMRNEYASCCTSGASYDHWPSGCETLQAGSKRERGTMFLPKSSDAPMSVSVRPQIGGDAVRHDSEHGGVRDGQARSELQIQIAHARVDRLEVDQILEKGSLGF